MIASALMRSIRGQTSRFRGAGGRAPGRSSLLSSWKGGATRVSFPSCQNLHPKHCVKFSTVSFSSLLKELLAYTFIYMRFHDLSLHYMLFMYVFTLCSIHCTCFHYIHFHYLFHVSPVSKKNCPLPLQPMTAIYAWTTVCLALCEILYVISFKLHDIPMRNYFQLIDEET